MLVASRCLLAVGLVLTLSACVTTNVSRLGTATENRPVVLPENVALYRVADQVPNRYEEVALLNSTGDSGFTDEARMFDSMKEAAGEVGANAVILDAVSEPGHGAKVAAAIFGVSAQRKGKALAIWVFPKDHPAAVNDAPSQALPAQAAPDQTAPAQADSSPAVETCVSCGRIGRGL